MSPQPKGSAGLQITVIVGALILVAGVTALVWQTNNQVADTETESSQESEASSDQSGNAPGSTEDDASAKADLIQVSSPQSGEVIASPVVVTGKARGTWFFEASFPIKVLDSNNATIGQGIAQAQADWMTNNFVSFTAEITFTRPTTATGYLLLEKDNPSGLPENADSLKVPIKF